MKCRASGVRKSKIELRSPVEFFSFVKSPHSQCQAGRTAAYRRTHSGPDHHGALGLAAAPTNNTHAQEKHGQSPHSLRPSALLLIGTCDASQASGQPHR